MGAAYATIGELVEFDFASWPRVTRWLKAMKERPSWAPANVAFEGWRAIARTARLSKAAA